MPKRGGKQGGARGARGGGRGGHSSPNQSRGGGRPGFRRPGGEDFEIDRDDHEDSYLSHSGINRQFRQNSTKEEEVYRRLQQAKAGGGRRSGENSPGYRARGSGEGFRPPPPPKQNAKGKNSKHFFWPHPDYNNNNNNNNGYNNNNNYDNTQNRRGQTTSSNLQRGKPKNGSVQVLFNRATSLSNPATQGQNVEEDDDYEDDSENDSSDNLLIDRGIDSDDDTDEEFLMQQFNWIEEEQDRIADRMPQFAGKRQPQQLREQYKSADPISAPSQALSALTLDNAMTQSEDFLQGMEAEGDINVHADEMVMSSTLQLSQDGTVLESQTEVVTEIVSAVVDDNNIQGLASPKMGVDPCVAFAVEKPKKKAHRSKRGGVKQREKQINKQMVVGHDDDGLIFLEEQSDDDEDDDAVLALEDYLQNTKDPESLNHLESLLGALKGLHAGGLGHSKSTGGMDPDDSDYEQQASEVNDDSDQDDYDEDDFDFEEDYEDGIKKLDFRKVSAPLNDKRKSRKVDDLLRDELEDLIPLWRSGAMQNGDGANRPFKSRAKGYAVFYPGDSDSDDGFMVASSVGGKKKNKKNKNKNEPHGGSFETLADLKWQIEDFVKDRTTDSLQLPPMPKPLRRKVHLLCNYYNLKSQSVGSGKRRFPILVKTDHTKMPINPVNINKLLSQSEKELKELTRLSAQFQGTRREGNGNGGNGGAGRGKGKGRGFGSGGGGGGGLSAAPHGTIVGASASAISGENLGHRMLTKMGWSPGVGLGAAGEGITQPIEAIVRAKRRGLGHE